MRYTFKEDTIVALSTPLGNGAIAVVRLSGPSAFEIINRLTEKKIKHDESHKAFFRTLQSVRDGSIIDQVVITLFKSPNSYTGEDVVEISSHCNPLIINKIINDTIFCGARIAEPGEFTFRAFMNNKMDLSQAESVADIIQARTNQSLNQSIRHLEGNYSRIIQDVKNEILGYLSLTEINLDFSDEEIEAIPLVELENKIISTIKRLKKLIETYDYGRLLHSGIKLLLIGKPNVGKSSLLNLLLGKERAIVSHVPGTTRDYIEANMEIDGILVNAVDTAGIRETGDHVESIGVDRTIEQIRSSDVALCMFEGNSKLGKDDYRLLELVKELPPQVGIVIVLNKMDLGIDRGTENILKKMKYPLVYMSVVKENGIVELKVAIKKLLFKNKSLETEEIVVTSSRHRNVLEEAIGHLTSAKKAVGNKAPEEIISVDLRLALNKIGEITGETSTEDILNNIFSNFCIGK